MIKLINDDCLNAMKKIADKSIDAIITDPPYGTTACKWDSIIPFEPMWNQLKRIIKESGAIVLFGSEPFSSALRMSNIKMYKYDWIWKKEKGTNFMGAKWEPLNPLEHISVFSFAGLRSNSKIQIKYNPQGIKPFNKLSAIGGGKVGIIKGQAIGKKYLQKNTGYPINIICFNHEINIIHPTQKPVALMEYLIKTYTDEGETVLDFTMGSGTTGVACVNLDRSFIGIEKDQKYFQIAEKRINESFNW